MESVMVTKYKVVPRWGKAKRKVVAVRCIQRGKTLFFSSKAKKNWITVPDFYDTPREAVAARIVENDDDMSAIVKELAEQKVCGKDLKALMKLVCEDEKV